MKFEVQISSGGVAVELNDFTERIVCNTIAGLVGSLHEVDMRREIHIVLKPVAGT
jgi:hypothetical protein